MGLRLQLQDWGYVPLKMGMRFWQTLAFADRAPLEKLAVTRRVEETWLGGACAARELTRDKFYIDYRSKQKLS